IAHPTFQEGDRSTFEIVVAGRLLDDGDVAIMMVEAGGTELSWDLYEDGAPKVTEEVIAEGLEYSKQWIAASIRLQSELRRRVEEEHGKSELIGYQIHTDYDDDVFAAVEAQSASAVSSAMKVADKHDRNSQLDEIEGDLLAALTGTADAPGPFADRAAQVKRA